MSVLYLRDIRKPGKYKYTHTHIYIYMTNIFGYAQNYLYCSITFFNWYRLPSNESCDTCGSRTAKRSKLNIVFVRVSSLRRVVIINHPVLVRRSIFGMSHGLTNTALALPPFPADAEEQHWRMRWIEMQPMQKNRYRYLKLTDVDFLFLLC